MARTDSHRRIALTTLMTLVAVGAAVPLVALAISALFPASDRRFTFSIACDKDGKPARVCRVGELPRAVLRDRLEAKTVYTRCVRKPSGASYCDTGLTTGVLPDRPVAEPLVVDGVGSWRVTWYVAGRRIGAWSFRVRA
ncbi:MAG: hypothetical protein M3Z33_02080 [Actinomycetota bacterium]|nr:hypothetical protein [Actinomycetota bacterium]